MLAGALMLLASGTTPLRAQAPAAAELEELSAISAVASATDMGPVGIIPITRGFNLSLGTSSQHDSANGWSSILNPNVAYRFNRHFSLDAYVPMYLSINIDENVGTTARPAFRYSPKKMVFGDTGVAFEGDTRFLKLEYSGVFALGLPSGNTDYGLGAGQVTYNINNHFEKNFRRFSPDIEVGFGDTSRLVNQRILKNYIAVGPMTHFQAGAWVDLPWNLSFEADAYEELPVKKEFVYSTTVKGKKKVTTATEVGPGEDNGFITSLDIPLSRHVTMSGFYNRSLRDHNDLAGFSFIFLMRTPRPAESEH